MYEVSKQKIEARRVEADARCTRRLVEVVRVGGVKRPSALAWIVVANNVRSLSRPPAALDRDSTSPSFVTKIDLCSPASPYYHIK